MRISRTPALRRPVNVLLVVCVAAAAGFATSAQLAAADSYPGCPDLAQGSSGSCVVALQQDLNQIDGAGLAADGQFGPLTRQAVTDFQRKYGLQRDSIVGSKTAQTLSDARRDTVPIPEPVPANYPPSFDPSKAARWAIDNAGVYQSPYKKEPCTDFTSHALAAGGMPHNVDWYDEHDLRDAVSLYINGNATSGPWANVTKSAEYWVQQGWAREIPLDLNNPTSASMARPGDLIYIRWDGGTHMVMVTGMDGATALKSDQNGGATPPYTSNLPWYLSHSHGDQPLTRVYPNVHATLLHWNEQAQ
ncbi:peptidoglycan-binding protein [Streptomyces sp. NPDC046759]|uniref:peptidoglycan-binding protein n=1 Tax=Streptomyces sp. NPDC046759 TaxID=3155019 RepID=UPI0033CFA51B